MSINKWKKNNVEGAKTQNTDCSFSLKIWFKSGAMASKMVFNFKCYLLLLLISYSSQNDNPKTLNSAPLLSAAHKELTNYGFPVGLLPATRILGYAVNQTSGEFSVFLGGSCKITLPPDNYVATYSKKITGKIVKGRIAELDGISVRAFFKWWSITGIRSRGDDIVFEVGMVTAKYPLKNFDESPACEVRHSAS